MSRITRFNLVLGTSVSWVYAVVCALTLYEVFMRYAMHRPTIWSLELSLILVALGYAIGGVLPTAQRGHLRIDSLYGRFPRPVQRVCDTIADLVGVGYLAAVTWAGIAQAGTAISMGERSGSAWNSWLPVIQKGVIPIAGFLMMVQILALMLDRRSGGRPGAEETTSLTGGEK